MQHLWHLHFLKASLDFSKLSNLRASSLGGGGGRGKEERGCNDVSEVFISASKKSTQNADWWILNLVLTSLLFACVVLTIQKWWKAEFLFVKVGIKIRTKLSCQCFTLK